MTARALLVGCGAEIGAMLVGMIDPERDGFGITAILTNPVAPDSKHPHLRGIDSLVARVVLAQPQLLDVVSARRDPDALIVRGRSIPVFWGDALGADLGALPGPFDLCIVATSKKHIGDVAVMGRFETVASLVVGVAEASALPALYPPLKDAPARFIASPARPVAPGERSFCLGSCQTNGWLAVLRGLLAAAELAELTAFDPCGFEVDIIHPDTPTGRLGTKSLAAREQDPRNNLRPSFSQVEQTMGRLFPDRHGVNTVSLRTLVAPPGYQICRFFFTYERAAPARLTTAELLAGYADVARRLPNVLRLADLPLGSRGFEFAEAAAVVLPQDALFRFADDPFGLARRGGPCVSELIVQAYVHNTRGYCRSVIDAARILLFDPAPRVHGLGSGA